MLKRLLRHPSGCVGLVGVIMILAAVVLGPLVFDYNDISRIDLSRVMERPSEAHLLGTDGLGRDVFARLLWGGQLSIAISLGSVAIGSLFGSLFGLMAGYSGGVISAIIMRTVDALMAFPRILIALFTLAIVGRGTTGLMIAIGISTIPVFCRISYGSTLSVRRREYIEAAQALGYSDIRILVGHVLPNIYSSLLVQSTLSIASIVILAAGLSFLGLGPQPPIPEWGAMIAENRGYLTYAPHIVLSPAIAILLLVLSFNLLGDGMRDVFDSKAVQRR